MIWTMSEGNSASFVPYSPRRITQLSGRLKGWAALISVTMIWGSTFVIMQAIESVVPIVVLLVLRFLIAAIVFVPVIWAARIAIWRLLKGIGVGVFLGLGVLGQAQALKTVSVDQVAFITGFSVVLVPFIEGLRRRRLPPRCAFLSVGGGFAGLVLLIGHMGGPYHIGTLWAGIAAVALAGQIVGTAEQSPYMEPAVLTGAELWGATLVMSLAVLATGAWHTWMLHRAVWHDARIWISGMYLTFVATIGAFWLQMWGQARLTATEAAVTFNFEPVWGALFAWVFLNQALTVLKTVGALLIFLSMVNLALRSHKIRQENAKN